MDQTLVRSGFDIEFALSERYLQYLLLVALDAGLIPASFEFDGGSGPITATLQIPPDVDRTYPLDPDAIVAEETQGDGFKVAILFNDPSMADIQVTAKAHLTSAALDLNSTFQLFVRLGLQKTPQPNGPGLDAAGLSIELVQVVGADLAKLKPLVDRTLSLDGLGNGGRVQDIALRKYPADGATPASLTLYLNMMLRSGPEADRFLEPRGDVLQGRNLMTQDADLVFATRKDIYGALAADAWYRRAVKSGSGYDYPLHFKHRDGTLLHVIVRPTAGNEGANRLRIDIKAEVEVDNWPNPDVTLIVDISGGVDDDGIMTWNSASEAHDSGLLYDFLLAGIAAALIPVFGPWAALGIFTGLEIAKHFGEELISDYYIGDRVEKRLDATLLDVAPNRLTLLRRRWDPFYETQHQVGLRLGGTSINDLGIAFWGKAALTRAAKTQADVVIRDTAHVDDDPPTTLRYRVQDIDPFRDQLVAHMPATDRRDFSEVVGDLEPNLFEVTVDEAIARLDADRLLARIPYQAKGIDVVDNEIGKLLVISDRETSEQRNRLIDEHTAQVTPQIVADNETDVRAQVLADFAASGVIPTPEQVDAAVAAGLQALIDADVQAYVDGALSADLEAALQPLLRLELKPTHFGKLQSEDILKIEDYDLIHFHHRDAFYYRDHYEPLVEDTKAKRLADNLRSKPAYRSTPDGPVFDV